MADSSQSMQNSFLLMKRSHRREGEQLNKCQQAKLQSRKLEAEGLDRAGQKRLNGEEQIREG